MVAKDVLKNVKQNKTIKYLSWFFIALVAVYLLSKIYNLLKPLLADLGLIDGKDKEDSAIDAATKAQEEATKQAEKYRSLGYVLNDGTPYTYDLASADARNMSVWNCTDSMFVWGDENVQNISDCLGNHNRKTFALLSNEYAKLKRYYSTNLFEDCVKSFTQGGFWGTPWTSAIDYMNRNLR